MSKTENFFFQQNVLIKFLVVFWGIFVSLQLNARLLIILLIFSLLFFIWNKMILLFWIKTILKLLPLFSSLIIFGMIFQISFLDQSILILQITFFLLLSVYCVQSSQLERIVYDLKFLEKIRIGKKLIFLFVSTIYFVPIFYREYEKTELSKKFWENISLVIHNSYEKIELVERITNHRLNKISHSRIKLLPQIYLLFLFSMFTFFWRIDSIL